MEEFEFDKYNITPSGKVYLKSSKSLFQEVELPPQVLARFILNKKNDESLFYYPKSTKIKNIMTRNNLVLIDSDVISINKVDYIRHPEFNNIFVSSGYKVFDILTFKFNKKPSAAMTIPFRRAIITELDEDHVFDKETNTINGEEINWDDPCSVESYRNKRYFHPIYSDTFVNFFGKPFQLRVNAETGTENEIPKELFYGKVIIRTKDGTKKIESMRFAYECFNKVTLERDDFIRSRCKGKYSICPFSLYKDKDSITNVMQKIIRHPRFTNYGLEPTSKKVFSYYSNREIKTGKCIKLHETGENAYKTIVYNTDRFIYECENNTLLDEDTYLVDGEFVHLNDPELVYNGEIFKITKNPFLYVNKDGCIFYLRYVKCLSIEDGEFINIGTKGHETKIALSDILFSPEDVLGSE